MPQYVDSFGRFVTREEAVENGMVKDGYSVRVPLMLSDGAIKAEAMSDSAFRAFADSIEGQAVLDRARRNHDISQAHRGTSARPFDAADAAPLLQHAYASKLEQDRSAATRTADAERDRLRALGARDARKVMMHHRYNHGGR